MSGATFLKYEKPILTCMVQADDPDGIKDELSTKSQPLLCDMKILRDLLGEG